MTGAKLGYLLWAISRSAKRDSSCPFCSGDQTYIIRRKAVVTALFECDDCGLRFRVPKEGAEAATEFYQAGYREGFTTDCPSETELQRLMGTSFRSSAKDYSIYIEVLRSAGLRPGDSILDFGCSWGYGSWQLREAGFQVYSFEVSQARAQYASERLGCHMLSDLDEIPERVHCFFSAHVIEHLPDPNAMWEGIDSTLSPDGMAVCFTPNGEPHLGHIRSGYHQLWGKVHPLLLTRRALETMAERNGFSAHVYCSPYSADDIRLRVPQDKLSGHELLLIAYRR